jgi:hypothetical protein
LLAAPPHPIRLIRSLAFCLATLPLSDLLRLTGSFCRFLLLTLVFLCALNGLGIRLLLIARERVRRDVAAHAYLLLTDSRTALLNALCRERVEKPWKLLTHQASG